METIVRYSGDETLRDLIAAVGVTKSVAEIKALLMRTVWRPGASLASDVVDAVLGAEGESAAGSGAFPRFREEVLALRNELAERRREGLPYRFYPVEAAPGLEGCLARIRCRVGELRMLLPLFDGAGETEEIGRLRGEVRSDFTKLVGLLDTVVSDDSPAHFAACSDVLSSIDASLAASFNRLGDLLVLVEDAR